MAKSTAPAEQARARTGSDPQSDDAFTVTSCGLGVMIVRYDDDRLYRPPAGWHPVFAEPLDIPEIEDAEVWVYARDE